MSDAMRDHWWWRPGWHIGQRMYTWHITFDGQEALHDIATGYQDALTSLSGLDLIPHKWLHLTMQGIGFTSDVSPNEATAIADAVQRRCAQTAPFPLTFGQPKVDPEAIMFALNPAEPAQELRRQVRAGIGDVWGPDRVPEPPEWAPHVSIAYSNATGPAQPYADALATVTLDAPATVLVKSVELIVLHRDNRMYEWETFATAQLIG